jgi:hypothetical protein
MQGGEEAKTGVEKRAEMRIFGSKMAENDVKMG